MTIFTRRAVMAMPTAILVGSWCFAINACKATASREATNESVVASSNSGGCIQPGYTVPIYRCKLGWEEGEDCLYCPEGYDYHPAFKSCYHPRNLHSQSAINNQFKELIGCGLTPQTPIVEGCPPGYDKPIYKCTLGWLEGNDCLYCPEGYDYHAAFKSCYHPRNLHSQSAVNNQYKKLIGCALGN